MTTWAFVGKPSPDTRTSVPPAPLVGFTKTEGLPGWVNALTEMGGGLGVVLPFHGDQASRPAIKAARTGEPSTRPIQVFERSRWDRSGGRPVRGSHWWISPTDSSLGACA